MQGDGKVVPAGVELDPAAQDDLLQQREAALPGDVEVAREDPVGDDDHRLVGVAAFPEGDLLDPERLGRLGLPEGHPGELDVVVPDAVVDRVVAGELAGEGPVDAGRLEDDGEGLQVLRPGEEFAGVVDQQDLRALLVHGDLDLPARLLLDLLLDELQDVPERRGGHPRARSRP